MFRDERGGMVVGETIAMHDRWSEPGNRVSGVPCVVVGGERAFVGALSEARFVARVARAGAVGLVG